MVATRTLTRCQDLDDGPGALAAAADQQALLWNQATGKFVATAPNLKNAIAFNSPGANFDLTAGGIVNDTWYATAGTATLPAVALPAAGTYLLTGMVRAVVLVTATSGSAYVSFRLWDVQGAVQVPGSNACLGSNQLNVAYHASLQIQGVYAAPAARTIQMQGLRSGGTAWTAAGAWWDTMGNVSLAYARLA
jgi:hypothetical protein